MLVSAFRGIARGERGGRRRDLERVDVLVPSLPSQQGSRRAARDSLNLAFTNQHSAATEGRRRERENDRGGNWMERGRSRDERSGPIPLSFFPCLCAPRQPTGQKEEADTSRGAVGEENHGTRGVKGEQGARRNSERAERRQIRTEEQGARNGAWILRSRIPLIYILSWR